MPVTKRPLNPIEKFFTQPVDFEITAIGSMDVGEGAIVCKDVQFNLCGLPGGFATEMVLNPATLNELMTKILVVNPVKKILLQEEDLPYLDNAAARLLQPGEVYVYGTPEFIGEIPLRQELQATPPPDFKPWKMVVIGPDSKEEDIRDHYKSYPDSYRARGAMGDEVHFQSLFGMGKGKVTELTEDRRVVETADGGYSQKWVHGHWMDICGWNKKAMKRKPDPIFGRKPFSDSIMKTDCPYLKNFYENSTEERVITSSKATEKSEKTNA